MKGLDQEFNTIDAQRAAVESYIASQAALGWRVMPERYDDGGFSGSNIDRPALSRLMADVDAGRVDVIAVYKIDRLSRSLVDFANLSRTLEQRGVGLVSITQHFDSATSMGKLTLAILISFASYERELIAERTADKIAASRRRGLWTGGRPVLGYDSVAAKLTVNRKEAEKVRAIFQTYLDVGSITETLADLRARGITNKAWKNARGEQTGGSPFTEQSLRGLLTNTLYVGRIRCSDGGDVPGAHDSIVDDDLFAKVAARLESRKHDGGRRQQTSWCSILGGLVWCARCGKSMGHVWSARGARRYRFYVCNSIQKLGAKACPGSRAPADQVEEVVISRVRAIGKDPQLVAEVARAIAESDTALLPAARERVTTLTAERKRLVDRAARLADAARAAVGAADPELDDFTRARVHDALAALQRNADELRRAEADVDACEALAKKGDVDPEAIRSALEEFDGLWDLMTPAERGRIVRTLVERVTVDVVGGEVKIKFSLAGARAHAQEGSVADDAAVATGDVAEAADGPQPTEPT